ncbi:MAG: DcaP family trimeric outer membrane transporter [Candidatus Omnitrophota bacterium]
MRKIISLITVTSFVFMWMGNSVAYSLTNEQLLEKMNNLEKQLSEVRSELRELKETKTEGFTTKSKETNEVKSTGPKCATIPNVEFYGFIKTDFAYDTSRMNDPDHPGYVMSETNTAEDNQFTGTVQNSRFGIDIAGPAIWGGQIKGKAEADFLDTTSDNSFRPRVRHLYVDLDFPAWDLLFGQTWDVIGPLGPETLNTNGYLWRAGNIGFRRTQVRLTNKFDLSDVGEDYITTKISANRNIGIANGTLNTGEDSGLPLMEARVSYTTKQFFDKKLELGFGGLYGEEEVDRASTSDDHWNAKQWGFVADILAPLYDSVTFKSEFFYGQNLDAFLAGIGQGVNTTTETEILAYGGWAQLSYKINDQFTLNSGYGIDHVDKEDMNAGDRYNNQVAFGNIIYSPIKHLKFGIEYSRWYTEYLQAENGTDDRLQTSVIWDF